MAALLHRLARASATRRWTTVIIWLLVIALVGTGTALLAKPLKDDFTIPESPFQEVLDKLETNIPEASGTTGAVAFTSADGFDEQQREAVADVVEEWSELDGVSDATDPFATQQELDETEEELSQGREDLADSRAELEDRRSELEAGEAEVAESQEQLEQARTELDNQQDELDAQAAELEASRQQLPPEAQAEAEQELAAGQQQLDAAREELEARSQQLEQAESEVADGREQLEAGEAELDDAETELEQGERLAELTSGLRQVSADGEAAMSQISFSSSSGSIDPEITDEVQDIGGQLEDEGVSVDYSTEIVSDVSSIMGPAELLGLVIAAVVLLVMLGSLVASGLPILLALVGVGVGLGAAMSLTVAVEMTTVTPVLALMLGLAVGIDYSLFILNRHRGQLAEGMDVRESIALAGGTAGNAVMFAGGTVIIALAALAITGIPFLTVMGLVAAGTVLVTVLASLTLTPALLSLLGHRVLSRRQRNGTAARTANNTVGRHGTNAARRDDADTAGRDDEGGAATSQAAGGRWAGLVQRHPWLSVLGVVAVCAGLAILAQQLWLGLPDGSSEPADSTAYRTYDIVRDHFGAGANGPIIAVATLDEAPANDTAATGVQLDIAEDLAEVSGVEDVVPAGTSHDDETLAFQLTPSGGPADEDTVDLVHELRDGADVLGEAHGAEMGYTGMTVANIDISEQLGDALAPYLLVVVGLSLVLLLAVFRSIWVPVLATAGFLLSLGAAFGGVVAVYQLGIGAGIFGVNEPGPVVSFLPIILIGVMFGLAMDYQVFLVSAVREAHVHGAPARSAVRRGFGLNARVVTAAAIIMIAVFGSFTFADLTMIRPFGFGLALGVLVDAFLIRMTLTPAVLSLLGQKAWWLPGWLDRLVPHVDVEGARLERHVVAEEKEFATAGSKDGS